MTESHPAKGRCPYCGCERVNYSPEIGSLRTEIIFPSHRLLYKGICQDYPKKHIWIEKYAQMYQGMFDLKGNEITVGK